MNAKDDPYYIHPSGHAEDGCAIGDGTRIWHFSHVMKGARIGRRCKIGQNVVVHPNAVIGDDVKIQNNVSVYDAVTLEDDVFCGPSCVFTNILNPRSAIARNSMDHYTPTLVRRGASIGANATIVCGTVIGAYALIGAGAVVTKDVPDYALVYGNPARIQGWVCTCGYRLQFDGDTGVCTDCGRAYARTGETTVSPQ